MNKILLIIQREYLSRVKKKSFLVITFLVPVLFIAMYSAIIYLAVNPDVLGDKKKIQVIDESGWFANQLKSSATMQFTYDTTKYAVVKSNFLKSDYDYLLYIPASLTGIQLYGEKKPSTNITQKIEETLSNVAQTHRLADAHIDSTILANAQKSISIEAMQLTQKGDKNAHVGAAFGVGMICAFLIYMALLLYGVQVMRGVLEEKVSRIVEVIISSVKPMQLMMGKIIGVGLVGLTQFVLWIVLSICLTTLAGTYFIKNNSKALTEKTTEISKATPVNAATTAAISQNNKTENKIMDEIKSIPVVYTVTCFLFYFLFGFLLYSAVFAAVGSAVDSETETQQFMMPITLPLIFTITLSQTVIVNNPDSSLSFWLSMIPFTSPIAMMIRIQYGVPDWQLALSMLLLVLGFVFTCWAAARIYRVGILMYGKKASYKELAKWFMYKE